MVILGFIPSDQRKFSYNFVFGLVLTIIKIAEKYGGRAYSTGLYFTKKADDVLGTERAERIRAFKKDVDPKGLLNPNKVIGNGLMGSAMSLASAFEPLIRPFGSLFSTAGTAMNRPQFSFWSVLVSAAVNVGLNILLIPRMGGIGAAVATAAAVISGAVAVVILTLRRFREGADGI